MKRAAPTSQNINCRWDLWDPKFWEFFFFLKDVITSFHSFKILINTKLMNAKIIYLINCTQAGPWKQATYSSCGGDLSAQQVARFILYWERGSAKHTACVRVSPAIGQAPPGAHSFRINRLSGPGYIGKKKISNPHATRGLSEWSGFVVIKGIFKDLSPDKVLTNFFLKLTCAERVMILTSARTCN